MTKKMSSGAFVPTTSVWDTSEIYREKDNKSLFVKLYQNLNVMALALNLKDTGYYTKQEFVCGQLFYPSDSTDSSVSGRVAYRPVYRKVIDCGALPNATSKNVAHGIDLQTGYTFTRIYGSANLPIQGSNSYIPLPYVSTGTYSDVSLRVSGVSVTLDTSADMSAFTKTYVILEYIKT